ncbi:MAG: hypothetical protein ACE144_21440 [Thermodesulfobacteriota bacterium]
MDQASETDRFRSGTKEVRELREELWILLPIFLLSAVLFIGSFSYRFEAAMVPIFMGAIALLFSGMRLFHVLFPRSKIGEFKEEGLGGEFETLKQKIKDDLHIAHGKETTPEMAFGKEAKAFAGLLGCFLVFFLLGYLVGTFFVIVGASYYYGFKKKGTILISLIIMYSIVYGILYELMEAPLDYGVVGHWMKPILKSFHLL